MEEEAVEDVRNVEDGTVRALGSLRHVDSAD
jgi:hypothetical protein